MSGYFSGCLSDSSSRSTSKSGQYRCSLCSSLTFKSDATFASLNQGNTLNDKKYSSPRTWSQIPCFEIPTTSTAEVLFPSVDDFIFAFFNNALNFAQLLTLQTVIVGQLYCRLQPKLCLAIAAINMDMLAALLLRKEEKPEALLWKTVGLTTPSVVDLHNGLPITRAERSEGTAAVRVSGCSGGGVHRRVRCPLS